MGIALHPLEFIRRLLDRDGFQKRIDLKQNKRVFAWGEDRSIFPKHPPLRTQDREMLATDPQRFVESFTGMKDTEPYCGRAEENWHRIAKEYQATGIRALTSEPQLVCFFDQEQDAPIKLGKYRVLFKDREFSREDMDFAYGNETGLVKIGKHLFITSFRLQLNGEHLVLLVRRANFTEEAVERVQSLFQTRR